MSCSNCSNTPSTPFSFDVQLFYNQDCFGCSNSDCGSNVQNAKCVIYTGPNLSCAGIETNDSLEFAIQKIDEQICAISEDYSTYQFACLEADFGDSITTEADFVDAITTYACEIRSDLDTFIGETFVSYQAVVDARFSAIEDIAITCASAGVTSSDTLKEVLEKYCEKFEDIDEELDLSGVTWDDCLTVVTAPINLQDAFDLIVDQICQVKALTGGVAPTFNNTSSCIAGGSTDSVSTTIGLIKTRLCQTPTFDKDDLLWSCLDTPTFSDDQDITAALQGIVDLIVELKSAIPTFDSGDFLVSQTVPSNVCSGVTVSLQSSLDIDRFVAVSALDASPGTLIDKLDAGAGIGISNNADTTIIITNTSPDQEVILNEGTGITITGTYPEFTISSAAGTDTNFATDDLTFDGDRLHNLTGFSCGLQAGTVYMDAGRFETDMGGDVTSSNNLTVGGDGNIFKVTGNTQVNAITISDWQEGSQIVLEFTGTPTVKHNTAGGAGTAPIFLAGSVDLIAGAGDSLSLYYNGTYWHEQSRKIAATATSIIFRNGLTESPAGIAEWGGTLLHNTTVNGGTSFSSTFTSSVSGSNATLYGLNTGTGSGVYGEAVSGGGVTGVATTGVGGAFRATSGVGMTAHSGTSYAALLDITPTTTATIAPIINLQRNSTGTAANNIGISIELSNKTTDGVIWGSNAIYSRWTNATTASRVSQFGITGVDNAITKTLLEITGAGIFTLTQGLSDYADDTAAAVGGIPLMGLYRTASVVKIRVA